ncbi:carbohydrate kinase family protein [Agriterribacter sp.]|uniref:carbohydrate kinase family protein n=1 Tax=Agriterribacter sp. TaxID=2821509 RepID=UPI002BB791B3|nr:carbohydrate kinase family protein [Agriterribacter sp.]HTN05725.1 carbohydrate kinase family protein [Agriterribacter sp.]
MEKQFDVLVAGELNADLILDTLDCFPAIGKEVLAHNMTVTLGSSSAIFACNLRTLGAGVAFSGMLGRDHFGAFIISELEKKGVDTRYITCSPEHHTGSTVVLNLGEVRANITYPGAMHHSTINQISEEAIHSSRHLHISSVFLQKRMKDDIVELLKKAKDAGLTTSLDPQWDPDEQWDMDTSSLLPFVDIFIPNAAEFKALTKTNDMAEALRYIRQMDHVIVVKNGREGAYLRDGRDLQYQPAFLNQSVADCIGAGDSFNAGFIYRFLQQRSLSDCVEFGSLIGAVNTTQTAGTAAFENIGGIKQIARNLFNYTF